MLIKSRILKQLENLEEEIQQIRLILLVSQRPSSSPKMPAKSIVETTSGILGKSFPAGTTYTRKIRKQWGNRLHRLGMK